MNNIPISSHATPEEVFRVATHFEHSAQVLAHSIRPGKYTGAIGDAPPVMIPLVVCMTFSVELYLKCLIWLETGKPAPRGHSLEDFFGKVSSTRQQRAKQHYDSFIAQSADKTTIESRLPQGFRPGDLDFDRMLKVASDGFADWRYAYERNMADGPNLVQVLAYAFRRTIIDVQSAWERFLTGLNIPPTSLTR